MSRRLGFLPRHTRGYLWIAFLAALFIVMALSENGVFDSYPRRQFDVDVSSPAATSPLHRQSNTAPPKEDAPKPPSQAHANNYASSLNLDPNDVAILVKTGATAIWRRMPAHMSTTLANPNLTPNILFYSDNADNINGNPVIDVLANVSIALKASPDFKLYNDVKAVASNNLYLEDTSMEGDFYLPGGWRLDKYKFLPMFQHAAAAMPGKSWYVYLEDDNYIFWEELYAWLGTLDHREPIMVGSPAFRLGEDFAHGGSGFAVSGKAMEMSFGKDASLAEKWEGYAREQCCGDQVLSHVLRDMGVERHQGWDGTGWAALQALPTWRIEFGRWNWCSPIMNIHKVHQRDISRLFVFEAEFKARTKGAQRIRYRDIFTEFAKGNINVAQRTEWNNYASAKFFSSSTDPEANPEAARKSRLSASALSAKPWYSCESCRKACVEWNQCLSWKYADDSCSLSHVAAMGQRVDEGVRMESGWMLDRIAQLKEIECEALAF